MLTVVLIVSLFILYNMSRIFLFFFFFQAEDGIRDRNVTGVQTCALPIWLTRTPTMWSKYKLRRASSMRTRPTSRWHRSEERRVGKECRSRWSPYHEKKKKKKEARMRCRTDIRNVVETQAWSLRTEGIFTS